jgi:hypothetical protein
MVEVYKIFIHEVILWNGEKCSDAMLLLNGRICSFKGSGHRRWL